MNVQAIKPHGDITRAPKLSLTLDSDARERPILHFTPLPITDHRPHVYGVGILLVLVGKGEKEEGKGEG